ncbi:MAG TPA: hypothetical protein VFY49_12290 [Myxococcota bacterium]|nr:hypothetical protein [Myxococcota bacterium]
MTADRVRAWAARASALPAWLLVLVATAQIVAAKTGPISPWLGGGFGMFATTDSPSRRHLHAVALREGLHEELELPEELALSVRKAQSFPSQRRLRALAREIEAWVRETDDPNAAPLEAIAISVYRVRFDRDTLAPSGEPVASLRVPAGEE